ncbi:MAG: hypothetical protein KGJ23_08690 [Euryarchaeota archaeon]|nr:hypothetical protein [Euryarchaeota archaeon]MDE1836680.1 hypothetical protein [Euryarchaeota archaeon]MDE1880291.1 hypothetical protein [Euryarchaeota archaeon]MDE2044650.1 hypothetical protein [Thermoplasmata archaeon]
MTDIELLLAEWAKSGLFWQASGGVEGIPGHPELTGVVEVSLTDAMDPKRAWIGYGRGLGAAVEAVQAAMAKYPDGMSHAVWMETIKPYQSKERKTPSPPAGYR